MTDNTYQAKVYEKQGGGGLVAASGGKITVEADGTIDVSAGTLTSGTNAIADGAITPRNSRQARQPCRRSALPGSSAWLRRAGTAPVQSPSPARQPATALLPYSALLQRAAPLKSRFRELTSRLPSRSPTRSSRSRQATCRRRPTCSSSFRQRHSHESPTQDPHGRSGGGVSCRFGDRSAGCRGPDLGRICRAFGASAV